MNKNKKNEIKIEEGKYVKGNIRDKPSVPRPSQPPRGQRTSPRPQPSDK